ncbi:hypothetical protein [Pseudanabaena sp. UWO311]|uniref:hypothetical protein n=1 Tax=Pseudanabaena sp. UWO311 TaxID=2487337 RepID=UPI0030D832BB
MPMNRSLYPSDWDAIATRIKDKAAWICQNCQRPCRKPNVSWIDFNQWLLDTGQSDWHKDNSHYFPIKVQTTGSSWNSH